MWTIIKDNAYYFTGILLFLIVGAVLLSQIKSGDLVLFFSDHRSAFGDFFFRYFTKVGEIFVYLVLTISLLFHRYRYAFLIPLTGFITLGVSLAAKNYFGHPRPVVFFKNLGIFDQINLVDGIALFARGSFPSGHTMSAFAMFGLLALILPRKKGLGVFLFIVALLVGISRVYLVQHFFKDVYAGALMGTVLALLIYYLQSFISYQPDRWYNQSLRYKRQPRV